MTYDPRVPRWIETPTMPLDLNGPVGVTFTPLARVADERPLVDVLAAAASRHAKRVAIDDGDSSLTYAALWQAACRMAGLIGKVAPSGRPIAVLLPNAAVYPAAWMGCLLAGRPAALLDSHYPPERNRQCMEDTAPAALIARDSDAAARALAGDLPFIAIEEALIGDVPPPPPPDPATEETPAFIIFTSGSTGRPKGIALGARAALHRAAALIDSVHMNPDDAVLSLVPPCVLGGVQNLLETFLAGATLRKLDLPRVALTAHAGRPITMLFAAPALLRAIARLDDDGGILRGLRCVQPVGDALLQADLRQLRALLPRDCAILNVYGSSEALASLQWFVPNPYTRSGAKVATGYPAPDYDCAIVTEDGGPAAEGEPGELVVRSRYTSMGEWRDGRLQPGPFRPDPNDPAARILATGDLAVRAADGVFSVTGRRDRLVKILGNRVEPAEIEEALRSLPGVLEAAVVARPGTGGEPELAAFIVPVQPTPQDLRDRLAVALRGALPPYMQPSRFVFLPSLPLLPIGKVDTDALIAGKL
jgi:acyl-coenzyme A synthetase/AMP-(fatty) acid ligase